MNNAERVVVLSCEHGGNEVPEDYKYLFKNAYDDLNSHRGYDIGALELFDLIESDYVVHKQCTTVSRLLVDVNRSLYRRTLFSEFTKGLSKEAKSLILATYYYAFRRPFEEKMTSLWREGKTVLHLSVHSFTPSLNGEIRATDFGILYNSEREAEKLFAKIWRKELNRMLPGYRVRYNYPFLGKPDGHVRYFRDLEKEKYLGIEFEMNQKHANDKDISDGISAAFNAAFDYWNKCF
jgi:predicted N-formylglutamate amidohydrolase